MQIDRLQQARFVGAFAVAVDGARRPHRARSRRPTERDREQTHVVAVARLDQGVIRVGDHADLVAAVR